MAIHSHRSIQLAIGLFLFFSPEEQHLSLSCRLSILFLSKIGNQDQIQTQNLKPNHALSNVPTYLPVYLSIYLIVRMYIPHPLPSNPSIHTYI